MDRGVGALLPLPGGEDWCESGSSLLRIHFLYGSILPQPNLLLLGEGTRTPRRYKLLDSYDFGGPRPELLEAVVFALVLGEKVDDDTREVDQHPAALA